MLVNKGQLKRLILEEMAKLNEDCGGGCGGGQSDYSISKPQPKHDMGGRVLSREEALKVVMIIAANTSCPVTSDALMDVVDNLSHAEGEPEDVYSDEDDSDADFDWHSPQHGHARGNIDDLDPQGAFSLGLNMGDSGDFADVMNDDEYGRARG